MALPHSCGLLGDPFRCPHSILAVPRLWRTLRGEHWDGRRPMGDRLPATGPIDPLGTLLANGTESTPFESGTHCGGGRVGGWEGRRGRGPCQGDTPSNAGFGPAAVHAGARHVALSRRGLRFSSGRTRAVRTVRLPPPNVLVPVIASTPLFFTTPLNLSSLPTLGSSLLFSYLLFIPCATSALPPLTPPPSGPPFSPLSFLPPPTGHHGRRQVRC